MASRCYRELNTKVRAFEQSIFDRLLTPSRFLARTGSSTNESLVSVTSTSGTGNSHYTIDRVNQLAKAASTHSKSKINGEEGIDPNTSFKDLNLDSMSWAKGQVKRDLLERGEDGVYRLGLEGESIGESPVVRVNGREYEVVSDMDNLDEGKVFIENGELTFALDEVSENARVEVEYVDPSGEGNYTKASMSTFDANGEQQTHTMFITESDSLRSVMNNFNNSPIGVTMFYDEFSNRVSVSRTETGVFNQQEGSDEIIFNTLNLPSNNEGEDVSNGEQSFNFFNSVLNLESGQHGAQNAKFEINGLETERQSNTFTIGNLTMTLRGQFDEPISVSSSVDTENIVKNITEFVEEYNALIEEMNGLVNERQNRDYPPLTSEQRSEMSDHEIELWEEKAQSGLMSRDRELQSFLTNMRMTLYQSVDQDQSNIRHLGDLGITTSTDYLDNGKLVIDEAKLQAAVENDPEGAYHFFAGSGENQGIARQLRQDVNNGIDAISRKAGGSNGRHQNHQFAIGRELNQLDSRIENFERRLAQKEQRYWRQFTAMEQAIARSNSQGDMLYNFMFGNGNF
ncbi:flagellar hook-associated protein FliD [Geomicrobium sp. JCM 19038]|nr:flagellar filament capping protein FliD [Geomicrobium sp. JCM 19038]GAK07227.1 flagellar hook-associated protein FliD [Geomicrobium sp. JCM 19038]